MQEHTEWKDALYAHYEVRHCSVDSRNNTRPDWMQKQWDQQSLMLQKMVTDNEKWTISQMEEGPEKEEAFASLSIGWGFREKLASIIRKGPAMEHMNERLAFFLDEIQERHLPVWETLSGCEAMADEIMAYSNENGPHKWEEVCEQLAEEGVTEEELDVIAALMYDPIEKVSVSNKPLPVEGTYAEDDVHQSDGDLYNKVYKGNGVWEEKLVGFEDWAKLFWEAARRKVLDEEQMPMLEKYEKPPRVPHGPEGPGSSPFWYKSLDDEWYKEECRFPDGVPELDVHIMTGGPEEGVLPEGGCEATVHVKVTDRIDTTVRALGLWAKPFRINESTPGQRPREVDERKDFDYNDVIKGTQLIVWEGERSYASIESMPEGPDKDKAFYEYNNAP